MGQNFKPAVFYRDPMAALRWLEQVFGFETTLLVSTPDGAVAHAEMTFGDDVLSVGGEWGAAELIGPAQMRSPASLGGANTQMIRVVLPEGLDGHCERARAAGAHITQDPKDEFYGARTYRALDLEGHVWNFEQPGSEPSFEAMEAATGLKLSSRLP